MNIFCISSKTLAEIRREVDRERKEREEELRRMREQTERERMEKENALRQMKQKEEQLERERKENADLRKKLSRASLASQVSEYDFLKVEFTQCAKNDFL